MPYSGEATDLKTNGTKQIRLVPSFYAISSKTTMRNVTRGSEYVLNALSVIGALAIGSPIAVTTSSSVLSTKYKVSKPKD